MPLVSDATALVALGEIGSIGILKHADPLVVISPWVADRELRQFSNQVRLAVDEGWLRILEPSETDVRNLIRAAGSFELDRGEAETIVIAGYQDERPTTLLIEEGQAHVFVRDVLIGRAATRNWRLACLADVLHDLQSEEEIDSAADLMQRLLDHDHYHWAPPVRRNYEFRCAGLGITPLPGRKSRLG